MKHIDKSKEIYDYRDPPILGDDDSEFVMLEYLEPAEEVHELDDLDEEESSFYPWSLFTNIDPNERKPALLENEDFRILIDRLKNSSIPTCFIDLDLKIVWTNPELLKNLIFAKSPINCHLPELFQTDTKLNLSALLKRDLEKPEKAYSWLGRLIPFSDSDSSSFIRALIQPCLCHLGESPKAFMVQLDVITPEYKELLQKTFLSLLEASKLKDNDTGDHIERVNEYSVLLSKHLQGREGYEEINDEFIEDITFLAAMHDVGKIGTPDDILNKGGPLDDWEREIMNEHTKNGAYILSTHPKSMAKDIALSHHEKWDGTGYPYGIFGNMIPLCARIVCIADVYDALRSKRSYKKPFTHAKSVSIMKKGRATHFDPALMDLFIKLNKEFDIIFNSNSE